MTTLNRRVAFGLILMFCCCFAFNIYASSHREAPGITLTPKVDGTDFYMFRTYDNTATQFDTVTIIANYQPLQDPIGGPNYFFLDSDALYEIHIDNDGDAVEDITFQFKFDTTVRRNPFTINGVPIAVPLVVSGTIDAVDDPDLNVIQEYSLNVVTGDRRSGTRTAVTNSATGSSTFRKPLDYIGEKTLGNAAAYKTYADQHIFDVNLPGGFTGKVFVGQRQESFAVNLGAVFDLINLDPTGGTAPNAANNTIANKNITAFALQVPIAFLTNNGATDIVGGWTTASVRQARIFNPFPAGTDANNNVQANRQGASVKGGPWIQVSRLGMPLVNELVIGLPDKDLFNHSEPVDDAQFAKYVTNSTLATLINVLFTQTIQNSNRTDLVEVFLTGVSGLNQPTGVRPSEMLRLNVTTPSTAANAQDRLGVLESDNAGFPNGRRPADDVVDISLQVVGGELIGNANNFTDTALPFTAQGAPDSFLTEFPYLKAPIPGGP